MWIKLLPYIGGVVLVGLVSAAGYAAYNTVIGWKTKSELVPALQERINFLNVAVKAREEVIVAQRGVLQDQTNQFMQLQAEKAAAEVTAAEAMGQVTQIRKQTAGRVAQLGEIPVDGAKILPFLRQEAPKTWGS
jgi:hypothetical protein